MHHVASHSRASVLQKRSGTGVKRSANSIGEIPLASNVDMKALQKELEKDPKHETRIAKQIKKVRKAYLALKKGFFATLVALLVESHNSIETLIIIFIEFVQNLAFCFVEVDWGVYGNKYGSILILFQVEEAVVKYTVPQTILVIVAIAVILIATMLVLAVYVVQSFMKSDFNKGVWPLRLLRTLVSMLASIFFLPIVYSLFKIFTCRHGLENCHRDPIFVGLRIISGIALPAFFAFTLLMSMTYFNPNPKATSISARPTARLELVELSAKTLLACFFVFAEDSPILREAVTLACSLSTAIFMWVYIPYYKKEINLYRFCLICQVIWGSILAIAVIVKGEESEDMKNYIFFAYCAGIIPGALISYFAFNARQNHATSFEIACKNFKVDSPDAFNTWEVVEEAKDGEHEKRFWSESQVEIATRFLITSTDPKALEIADKIYLFGTKKFPHSSNLMVQYAIFFLVFKEDSSVAASYLKKAEKATQMLIDTEFTIYQQQQEIKAGGATVGNKKLDAVDRVEFKQLTKEAKNSYAEARASIASFWLAIMNAEEDEAVDTAILMTHVSQMERSDHNATEAYNRLIQRYPLSVKVLSSYADFLDDIHNNHEESEMIRRRMKRICDAGLSDDAKYGTIASRVAPANVTVGSLGAAGSTAVNNNAPPSLMQGNHMTKKSKKAYKEYRKQVYNYSKGNSKVLTWMIRGIQVFFITLATCQLYASYVGSQRMNTGITWLQNVNTCRNTFINVHKTMRQIQSTWITAAAAASVENNSTRAAAAAAAVAELVDATDSALVSLADNSLQLYTWTSPREAVNDIWAVSHVPITFFNGVDAVSNRTVLNMTLMDATSAYIRRTEAALKSLKAGYDPLLDSTNLDWRFTLDNGLVTLVDAYTKLEHTLSEEIRSDIRTIQYAQIGIMAFCIICLLLTGFSLFVPVIKKAKTERETSLKAFLQIPRDVTHTLYGKYFDPDNASREDLNDDNSDEDDEKSSKNQSNSIMDQLKAQTGYKTMTLIARNGLLCIGVFFAASFVTDLILLIGIMSIPGGITDSFDISARASRIASVGMDVAKWGTSTYVYDNPSLPSASLNHIFTRDVNEILQSQIALLYGSTQPPHYILKLSPSVVGGISPSAIAATHGTYEAVAELIDFTTLLSNTKPILANDSRLIAIVHDQESIVHGYSLFSTDFISQSMSNTALLSSMAYTVWAIMVIVVFATYYIYWKRILNYLIKTENERTLKLLLMIPVEIVADIDSLRELLHLKRNTISSTSAAAGSNVASLAPPVPQINYIRSPPRASVTGAAMRSSLVGRMDEADEKFGDNFGDKFDNKFEKVDKAERRASYVPPPLAHAYARRQSFGVGAGISIASDEPARRGSDDDAASASASASASTAARRASSGAALTTAAVYPAAPMPRLSQGVQAFLARESARRGSHEALNRVSDVSHRSSQSQGQSQAQSQAQSDCLASPISVKGKVERKSSIRASSNDKKTSKSTNVLPNAEEEYME
ncbi:hypothetical protein BDR26DRAFT_915655 [Obelidium mucronatum]|nr:hypothetical protein BDR26DRAFT_915655 [Obelidium mucronatum]